MAEKNGIAAVKNLFVVLIPEMQKDVRIMKEGKIKMAEWISVKDHKPKEFVSVLGHMTDAGEFPSVRECYRVGEAFFFPALKDIHPVDKWMEMPEPPKGE